MPPFLLNLLPMMGKLFDPKILCIILVALLGLAGWTVHKKLENNASLLAKTEVERAVLIRELNKQKEYKVKVEKLLEEVQTVNKELNAQRIEAARQLAEYETEIQALELETLAKSDPVLAGSILTKKFKERLDCIENASGGKSECVQ